MLKFNDFKLKPYFRKLNVNEAKLRFKIVSYMVPNIKMNFQSEKGLQKIFGSAKLANPPMI